MNIEIVEFYPIKSKKTKVTGTLHVYVTEEKLDIRGILVKYEKKRSGKENWFFKLPYRSDYDSEKQVFVDYPIINFTDPGKQDELKNTIRSQGIEYIVKNYLETDLFKPYVAPKKIAPTNFKSKNYSSTKNEKPKMWTDIRKKTSVK